MKQNSIANHNVENFKNSFFISINGTEDIGKQTYFSDKENVKVLRFDDVDKDYVVPILEGGGKTMMAKAFTPEQAKELFEFIDKHTDKHVCILHCHAGISRSGAVGQFICDYTGSDKDWFKQQNRHILPNNLVYRLLKEQAEK